MALEDLTGSNKYISNLVVGNPLANDDRREGDDHIRGIKNVLRNTFPNANAVVDPVQKAGDTMTGQLKLPAVQVEAAAAPVVRFWTSGAAVNQRYWHVTGQANGNLAIYRSDDANTLINTPALTYQQSVAKWCVDTTPIVVGTVSSISTINTIMSRDESGRTFVGDISASSGLGGTGISLSQCDLADSCIAHGFASGNKTLPYYRHTDSTVVSWTGSACDPNYKTDIAATQVDALALVGQMEFIQFNWKPGWGDPSVRRPIGFNARNLQAILADLVTEIAEQDGGGLFVNDAALLPCLAKALQELAVRVAALEAGRAA